MLVLVFLLCSNLFLVDTTLHDEFKVSTLGGTNNTQTISHQIRYVDIYSIKLKPHFGSR